MAKSQDKGVAPPVRPCVVSVDDVLDFVFVKKRLQHPQTVGRLLAFGLFGPLDVDKQLRSGIAGVHVVQPYELDAMCAQFEREDLVQIYMPFGYPVSTMTQEEMQSVINQADAKLRTAKGKTLMPQVTEKEVRELFSPLTADGSGMYSFHDIQRQILQWRVDRIAKYKVTYPSNVGQTAVQDGTTTTATSSSSSSSAPLTVKTSGPSSSGSTEPTGTSKSRLLSSSSSSRVSARVAPPTMFLKSKGLRDAEINAETLKLLSHQTYRIASLGDANSVSLQQNVRLLRDSPRHHGSRQQGGRRWDKSSGFKGTQVGSYVQCARSSSTCKRKVTIANK